MKKLLALIVTVCIMLSLTLSSFAATCTGYHAASVKFVDGILCVEGWFYNVGNTTEGNFTNVVIRVFDKNNTLVAQSMFNDDGLKSIRLSPGQGKKWAFSIAGAKTDVDISEWRVECNFIQKSYGTHKLEDGVKVYYNGNQIEFDVAPTIENGRTLVPIGAIFKTMGATAQWDGATKTAIAKRGNTEIKLVIDSTTAYVNGNKVILDVPAKIVNGRTLVPLGFVSKAFGCTATWGGADKIVGIYE